MPSTAEFLKTKYDKLHKKIIQNRGGLSPGSDFDRLQGQIDMISFVITDLITVISTESKIISDIDSDNDNDNDNNEDELSGTTTCDNCGATVTQNNNGYECEACESNAC